MFKYRIEKKYQALEYDIHKEEARMKKGIFMMMTLSALVFVVFLGAAYAKDEPVASTWASAAPKIDGLRQDWEGTPLTPQKFDVQLGFKNDSQFLYILLVLTNPKNLSSIEQTGITIFFNPEGQKKKDFGINFRRLQLSADQFIAMTEQKQGPLGDEEKARLRTNPRYSLFNYGIINKGSKQVLNADESQGILPAAFRISREQMALCYEFAIPLKRAAELAPGLGTEPGKTVTLNVEWGGWSKQMQQFTAAEMAQMETRARDERASDDLAVRGDASDPQDVSGMRMGESPGMASMRKMQPKKFDFWVNVRLANLQ